MELYASMMCASYGHLANEVEELDAAGIDSYHIDIMDGSFVDNFGMGYQDMEFIKKNTSKKIDVHLMVQHPYNYLPLLFELKADLIYLHYEVMQDPATCFEKIHKQGLQAGIAINPGTAICCIEEILNTTDQVLVLGVNPGHAGRQYQDYVDNKIEKLLELRKDLNFKITMDGGITPDRLKYWKERGVDNFVLGTASLFGKNKPYKELISNLRN